MLYNTIHKTNYTSIKKINPRDISYQSIREMNKIFDQIFIDVLFKDIFDIFKSLDILNNKENIIIQYLKSGKIQYQNGVFTGDFNSKISKTLQDLGGYYDINKKGYILSSIRLPEEVNRFIILETQRQELAINEVLEIIDNVNLNKIDLTRYPSLVESYIQVYTKIDEHFKQTIPFDLNIDHSNNGMLKRQLTEDFIENLDLSIKKWVEEDIIKMRTELTEKVLQGQRSETLKDFFVRHYNMSQTKAEQLAEGEVRLALSTYNKSLAVQNDIYKYKWAHPNPTSNTARKGHVHLHNLSKQGVIFDFREPPINIDTGKHTEPGLEYNCGCFAILQVE